MFVEMFDDQRSVLRSRCCAFNSDRRILLLLFPVENIGGTGPRPPRHCVRLQRQDELHDALRLDVSSQLTSELRMYKTECIVRHSVSQSVLNPDLQIPSLHAHSAASH